MQQLDALSLAELLQVRAKVDALIQEKSLYPNNFSSRSYQRSIYFLSDDIISKLEANRDDSLEKLIQLVDQWMDDDEEAYPEVEAGLNQHHPRL